MFHSTENTDKGFGGKCFLWIILLYAFGMAWAGIMTCNEEDLWHFTPETWSEACHAAGMSRLVWNARIGELACYFVGGNFRLWVLTLQPLCLVMSVFSIYRLAIGEWPNRLRPTGITLLFITFAILAMHSGLDWFSGNCNWFYPCSIALFFFAIVEHVFYGRFSMPWKKFFLLLPLTVIIGMSNEVVPLVSLCFFGGAGVYRKMRDKAEWGAPYTILLLTLAVSAALFYCAPAGAARFEASDAELSLGSYLQSLSSITSWLYFPICFWRLFLIGIILLLWKPGMNKLLQNRRYLLIIIALCMIWGAHHGTGMGSTPRVLPHGAAVHHHSGGTLSRQGRKVITSVIPRAALRSYRHHDDMDMAYLCRDSGATQSVDSYRGSCRTSQTERRG